MRKVQLQKEKNPNCKCWIKPHSGEILPTTKFESFSLRHKVWLSEQSNSTEAQGINNVLSVNPNHLSRGSLPIPPSPSTKLLAGFHEDWVNLQAIIRSLYHMYNWEAAN